MGLDLSIRIQENFKIDRKGRNTWTVTELANLHNCWKFLEALQHYFNLHNCTTVSVYGCDLHDALRRINDKNEIKIIKNFLKENNILDDDGQAYEIHAWW